VTPAFSAETPAEPSAKPAAEPAAASPAVLSRRLEDLQQEIVRLQSELTEVKKQLASGPSASAAAPVAAPAATAASPAPAAAPAPAAPVAPAPQAATGVVGFLSSIGMSGTVDGYYAYNFNHPRTSTVAFIPGTSVLTTALSPSTSALRAFDGRAEQISLNLFELNFDKAVDPKSPLGFHLAFGYGDAMNVVNSTDPGSLFFAQYLKEAYFSYLAPVGKGLKVDFGKFVTTNGAEVIETKDNWNYSRSLLFTFAIPFYHFGLRAKYPINDKVSITGLVVNGWNNIVDNNTGKTFGVSVVANPTKKVSITQNYYLGPEQLNSNSNWRQLSDTVVTYNPTGKLSLMTNFDYGREKPCFFVSLTNPCPGDNAANPAAWWSGIAQYARYALNDTTAVAVRYEYLNDHNNYAFSGFSSRGPGQHVHEGTVTLERVLAKHLITRWEYRGDVSNLRPFTKGTTPFRSQSTAMVGLIYVFDTTKP
jgi:hypothetical protein